MTVKLSPLFNDAQLDGSGNPYTGAKLFTYQAGSSTKQTTYKDSAAGTQHANPIELNSRGEPPAPIWLTAGQTYKFVLTTPADSDPPTSPIRTIDNVSGVNDATLTLDEWTSSGVTPTYVGATQFTVPGDQTTEFHVNRRLKTTITAGTGYNTITAASFGASVTSVTVNGTSLDSGLSAVSLAILRAVNPSVPGMGTKGDILTRNSAGLAALAVGTNGHQLTSNSGSATGQIYLPPSMGYTLLNGYVSESRGSNATTYSILGWDGNAPSATNPVYAVIRSATSGTGLPALAPITAATALTISSGSTLGAASATAFKLWFVLFNDASTYRLGVINCLAGTAPSFSIYPLAQFGIASSTAEGGSGAADSAQVFYTGSAVSSKPYVVLGYASYEAGLVTAGTWDAAPTRIQGYGPGVPLPGTRVQSLRSQSGAVATGTTTIPSDDSIPQNAEGDQYLSQAITPTSAAHLLHVNTEVNAAHSAANSIVVAIFQDSTANALAAKKQNIANNDVLNMVQLTHLLLSATTSATTIKTRAGGIAGGTLTVNGESGGRLFGGVAVSALEVHEIAT